MPRIGPTLAALVLAAACNGSTTAPELGDGTFVLRTVAGDSLPTRVHASFSVVEYLTDTLRFDPISLALFSGPTVERRIFEQVPGGQPGERFEFLLYVRNGDAFSFSFPCGSDPLADCAIGIAAGTLNGALLEVMAHPNSGLRSPLVYERIQ